MNTLHVATVSCSRTLSWDGGVGCIAYLLTLTSSRALSDRVRDCFLRRFPCFTHLSSVLGRQPITCSSVELVNIPPPSGMTCDQYLGPFIQTAGGYLTNGNDTSNCKYCEFSTTDGFLELSFNIYYSNHWRDLGIFFAFIVFNVRFSLYHFWLLTDVLYRLSVFML